jgi:hypothetical protein
MALTASGVWAHTVSVFATLLGAAGGVLPGLRNGKPFRQDMEDYLTIAPLLSPTTADPLYIDVRLLVIYKSGEKFLAICPDFDSLERTLIIRQGAVL